MKFLFYFVFVEHFSKCKSRQQKQGDTDGKSRQSTITGFLTGTKRKESAGPSEQETQRKRRRIRNTQKVIIQSTRTLTIRTVKSKYDFVTPEVNRC